MSLVTRRALLLAPLVFSLGWLAWDAPGPFAREAYFVALVCGATLFTRTVSWGTALAAVSMGIGIAAPGMVLVGFALTKAGLDLSDSVFASWFVVPIIEESVKLIPVFIVAALHRRRTTLTLNPSDWLLVGCAAGAGFAMVENAQLVQHSPGVVRDMARQYGPSWLVPGAWGAAGYVGHAAATGMVAAGVGLWRSLKRDAAARHTTLRWSRVALWAPCGWVVAEHMLANLYVNTGSSVALVLGNGRLTPWLFLAVAGFVITLDVSRAKQALAHSRTFRMRFAMTRESLFGTTIPIRRPLWTRVQVAMVEIRMLNAAAWLTLERLAKP